MAGSGVVLPPRHHSTTPISIREMKKIRAGEAARAVGKRRLLAFTRVPAPLLLLLLAAAASSWPLITASSAVIEDGVTCKMCASCDNPCNPSYSPPPPPPDSPGTIFYWSPPPPSGYEPPPPSPYGGGGGNPYFAPPPPGIYYPAPPPPNPVLPYFPFYYYSPPFAFNYNSGSVPLKPLCSLPLLFLLPFLLL